MRKIWKRGIMVPHNERGAANGDKLNPARILQDYPRPLMVRNSYLNLNGPWQVAFTDNNRAPTAWPSVVLVPFAPECPLSGVGKTLQPGAFLWYRRIFTLPEGFVQSRVLLHFGAVDQNCDVYLNGQPAGSHQGGFLPFTLDVTDALNPGGAQVLTLCVSDATDTAAHATGRQKLPIAGEPQNGWHGPQSGIWQTVWLESVPERYVAGLTVTPLYDESAVEIVMHAAGGEQLVGEVQVWANTTMAARAGLTSGKAARITLPNALSWTPQNPFLYKLRLITGQDAVESYFGMRKLQVKPGAGGAARLWLNNRPFVGAGVLDAGVYPGGGYTAPSDKAIVADLKFAKACGFTMLRKSGKLESQRFYYHCDRLGLLVWQDLPAGGQAPELTFWQRLQKGRKTPPDSDYARYGRQDEAARARFLQDMEHAVKHLQGHPSLAVWCPFQEGAGQFDSALVAARLKALDPARLVDPVGGGPDMGGGDFVSLPADPARHAEQVPWPDTQGRAGVLARLPLPGYVENGHFSGVPSLPAAPNGRPAPLANSREAMALAITDLYRDVVLPFIQQGGSVFFLSQLADTGCEPDGLLTGDRQVQKLKPAGLARLNRMAAHAIEQMK